MNSMQRVYLDNNATTPLLPEVLEAMQPYFLGQFGNASSIHQQGQQARAAVEHAREHVADLIGAREAEIVFTSGGTEGDNLALFGLCKPGDHLIISTIEHHAVLNSAQRLKELGVEVTDVPVDGQGIVDPDAVKRALRANTRLISIMLANNETGVVQNAVEIGKIAAEADVYFHTDAVQAIAKIPVDVNEIRCDLLTLAGHKIHAPQGTGALYVRKGTILDPLFYGGRHERSRRAGTENLPGIVGLGKAAELAMAWFENDGPTRMAALRDRLEQTVVSQLDQLTVNSGSAPRVPNTTNVSFDGIEGEAMVIALDLKGLSVSTGAACSSGAIEPSHVLTAMGLTPEQARGSIRFSVGKQNTEADIQFALERVPEVVAKLRELSPVYRK
ncbi:aminotransferase, class V [Candidatus Koribacter versatilis Ellin345]|uniref:cysteine desulfurase n=2 Tax=Candidatus Korobacter versatilis TaxID=658062 RepID=Q1IPC4_KORVE|nr:aminotransferase, class V [Candidatus Koribacter versatilis Ellin345]